MRKMILASSNKHKLEEIQDILKDFDFNLVTMKDAGLVDYEIIEDGDTFEENALIKARTVRDELGVDSIADDSGLMVEYLNGAPGVYSARYSGENANDQKNNDKLLKELKNISEKDRNAKFVSVIAVAFTDGREFTVRGEVEGVIIEEFRGSNGFGYDPLFYMSKIDKTMAQLNKDEKNKISHRARSLEKLKTVITDYIGE